MAQGAMAADFQLRSSSVKNNEQISNTYVLNGFGCSGANVSPELAWKNAPEGTNAYAIMMYDPDAPTGSGWWHWVVFNIPSQVNNIKEGASGTSQLPAGAIESRTDFGKSGYGGPCPPQGDKAHRYQIKVFALKDKLPLDENAPAAMVGFYIHQMKLAEAVIQAKYGR